jgi:hypothetical protein
MRSDKLENKLVQTLELNLGFFLAIKFFTLFDQEFLKSVSINVRETLSTNLSLKLGS